MSQDSVPRRLLPKTVVWLGVVSLLTDASSELIYPLLPLFVTSVLGAAPSYVGLIEGIAETTASLLKLVSGRLADRGRHKKPLTLLGYSVSSLVRPLTAVATAPWMVLAIRFADRVGKGIRSAPRDAIVAAVTSPERRGSAFGYHRAMDNTGAVLGPLLGFALIGPLGLGLRTAFALAAVPAVLSVLALAFGVREPEIGQQPAGANPGTGKHSSETVDREKHAAPGPQRALRLYFVALGLFTLANASDAFLLLRAHAAGIGTDAVLLLWTLHNGIKALLSHRLGTLSDRLGRRALIATGWLVYALCYLGFGAAAAAWQVWVLFGVYGFYYALVEGSERALVADLAPPEQRGRFFGYFHATTGLLALPASLGFGLLYRPDRPMLAFAVAAGLAAVATAVLFAGVRARPEGA